TSPRKYSPMTKTLFFRVPSPDPRKKLGCTLHSQSAAASYVLFQSLTHGVDTNFGLVNFKQRPMRSSARIGLFFRSHYGIVASLHVTSTINQLCSKFRNSSTSANVRCWYASHHWSE